MTAAGRGFRVKDQKPRRPVRLVVDGHDVIAEEGDTVAAALLAAGRRLARFTARTGDPRGYFCGIALCADCLMTVDGRPNARACVTAVRDGLRVETQRGLGPWEAPA